MVKLAIEGRTGLEVSDIEINKKDTSYSVETLRMLKEKLGEEADLFFITGADALSELPTWKDIDEIFKLSHFVLANRPNFALKGVPKQVLILKIPDMEFSSTEVRKRIREGKPIDGMVPEKVIAYIKNKSLYR